MIRHHIKLAFRNFLKHRSSFLINVFGLTTGIACTIFIFLWVNDELSMDQFHQQGDRLFRVMEHQAYADDIMTTTSTPGLLANALKEEVPEIEYAATVTWVQNFLLSFEDRHIRKEGWSGGADFFNLFSFELLAGKPDQVLQPIDAIVLSKSTAESFFGSWENAMGQSIKINQGQVYQVSGVFDDIQGHSSMQFDFITTLNNFEKKILG